MRTAIFVLTFVLGSYSHAAEIRLLSSPGVAGPVRELVRQFESATGHKVVLDIAVFAAQKRRIDAGEAFDVAILSPALMEDLIQSGKIIADTRVTLGRTGLGLAGQKGAPKPDISSTVAFKQAMLNAPSVAYSAEGGSGKPFLSALDRLGIAAEMKPKLRALSGSTTRPVASGDVTFAVTGVGIILADSGVELVGTLTPEIQTYVVFTLGASALSKEPEAAKAIIRFFTSPDTVPVLNAYGVEPGP
jgi:molybdate transport system substrate-binding protein